MKWIVTFSLCVVLSTGSRTSYRKLVTPSGTDDNQPAVAAAAAPVVINPPAVPEAGAPAVLMTSETAGEATASPDGMETVEHQKEAGNGYAKGSPLYDKQQKLEESQPVEGTPIVVKQGDSPEEVWRENLKHNWWTIVKSMCVYFVAVLVFAFFYHKSSSMTPPPRQRDRNHHPPMAPNWLACGFAYCIWDFKNMDTDWGICCMACFCPLIRFAETVSRARDSPMGFWAALIIMLVLVCLEPFTFGLSTFMIVIIWLCWRMRLRTIYNHTHHKTRGSFEDILMVCCCSQIFGCCMLVQEAREVEFTTPNMK